MTVDEELVQRARELADSKLARRATAIDHARRLPRTHWSALARAGMFGLTVPREHGGAGASSATVWTCIEELAAVCGVTAFVLQQHHSACGLIADGPADLASANLPWYAVGTRTVGVAFAHVRNEANPPVRVSAVLDGYRFDGVAPWFTGAELFDDVVIAGQLPSGDLVYALVPVLSGPFMSRSAPLRLAAMQASCTVALTFDGLVVPEECVVHVWSRDQQLEADVLGRLRIGAQLCGVSRAAISLIRETARDGDRAATDAADALEVELDAVRAAFQAVDPTPDSPQALVVRSWGTELAIRAAETSLIAVGGRGLATTHQAQRLCREALFYAVTITTPSVRAGMLEWARARSIDGASRQYGGEAPSTEAS